MYSLEHVIVEFFRWFSNNQMKANPDNCRLVTSKSKDLVVNKENNSIKNSKCKKLHSVKINKLIFNCDIENICKDIGHKINVLTKTVPCMK